MNSLIFWIFVIYFYIGSFWRLYFLLKGKLYHSLYEENNYLCRCVRVGWGRFRASTRLVKWSHYQARARADTPGKFRLFKGRKHYTIFFYRKIKRIQWNLKKIQWVPDSVKKPKKCIQLKFYLKIPGPSAISTLSWTSNKIWVLVTSQTRLIIHLGKSKARIFSETILLEVSNESLISKMPVKDSGHFEKSKNWNFHFCPKPNHFEYFPEIR